MDRDSLWTRRSNSTRQSTDQAKIESNHRSHHSTKRLSGIDSSSRSSLNGIPPLNTSTPTAAPGASSAFGLGSGAFASFGSSAKTPKTAGASFDLGKLQGSLPQSPAVESDKTTKVTSRTDARTGQTPPRAQQHNQTNSASESYPLKYSWVIWYRPPSSKQSDYEKSIKPMFKLSTGPEYWRIFTHLKRPSALPTVSDYHFFKDGIRPVWEDEENKKGGKWIMKLKKGVIDRYWDDLLLAVVGDQFAEAGEEVCGMVVSVRNGEDVLSIWTKNDGGRNVKIRETIKRVLTLPNDTVIIWKSHDDSIAQRTAIDQARQEKNATDKRRSTLNSNENTPGKERAAAA